MQVNRQRAWRFSFAVNFTKNVSKHLQVRRQQDEKVYKATGHFIFKEHTTQSLFFMNIRVKFRQVFWKIKFSWDTDHWFWFYQSESEQKINPNKFGRFLSSETSRFSSEWILHLSIFVVIVSKPGSWLFLAAHIILTQRILFRKLFSTLKCAANGMKKCHLSVRCFSLLHRDHVAPPPAVLLRKARWPFGHLFA